MAGDETPLRSPHLKEPWPKGTSGNPAGRPKGARSRFGEAFLQALLEDFEGHGADAIKKVRETDPSTYLRVAAQVTPKQLDVSVQDDIDNMEPGDLHAHLDRVMRRLRDLAGRSGQGAGEAGKPEAAKPAVGIPTVQ